MSTFVIVLLSIALLVVIVAALLSFLRWKRRRVHKNTILEADFSRTHEEHPPEDRLGRILTRGPPLVRDVIEALRMASEDSKVKLLLAKVGTSGMHMAKVQEIRDAVARFRSKGGKAVAYAESFEEIYEDFLAKAAEGRRMDVERVSGAAKGRIWTGRDALEKGLVDELGGLHEAIRAAKASAKTPEGESVGIKLFPVQRPLWKRLGRGVGQADVSWIEPLQGLAEALKSECALEDDVLRAHRPLIGG